MQKINLYTLIRWAPISQPLKFRLERRYMDWHWPRKLKAAEATRHRDHIQRGHDQWQYEYMVLADEEQAYYSKRLLKRARDLRVIVPAYYVDNKLSEDYEESSLTNKVYLSLTGETKVRLSIREEDEIRAKSRAHWVPYITVLTGLAGAITGLLSAIEKFGVK